MGLRDLIEDETFRSKTPMYIGEWNFSAFHGFILGYSYNAKAYDKVMDGFNQFVAQYYNWYESTAGWRGIIFKEMNNDHRKSIETFFILYDLFAGRTARLDK